LLIHYSFIKDNLVVLKWLDKLAPVPKELYMSLIKNNAINTKIKKIINDPELNSIFLRFSSRIRDAKFAKLYIEDVLNNKNILANIKSWGRIVKLTDYAAQHKLLPSSWCICDKDTFYRYIANEDIYVCTLNNLVYGINVNKSTGKFKSAQDQRNNNVMDSNILDELKSIYTSYYIYGDDLNKPEPKIESKPKKPTDDLVVEPLNVPKIEPIRIVPKSDVVTTDDILNKIKNIRHHIFG
jgi:hypothetical protein